MAPRIAAPKQMSKNGPMPSSPLSSAGGPQWKAWLASQRLPILLGALSVALTLPALGIGWHLDDHFQRLVMLEPAESEIEPMRAFSALDGDPERNRRYVDRGYLPWWTPEDFRLAFFRPLTLATVRLDYRLWPDSAVLMHAHSLLWLGALVAAVAVLFRRLLAPAWTAGLAGLLYAVDEAHSSPAAWLANRNALLAAGFGVLCLIAHDRWRRDGWRPGSWLSAALFALALLSGEVALATVGYLFAYALFVDAGANRWRSLLPHTLVLALWFTAYRMGGYGAWGSGLYLDPLRSPGAFLEALLERIPFLLMGQWTPIAAEAGSLLPPAATRFWWLVAVVVVGVLIAALWPLLRQDCSARFWGLGMLLALVPVSATFPANRLLILAGVGAMALLASFLRTTLGESAHPPGAGRRLRRGLAWALMVIHLVLAPFFLLVGPAAIRQMGEPMVAAAASLGSDPRLAEQDLMVVSTPDYLAFVTHLPTLQALAGRPLPRRTRALSAGPTAVELTRLDDYTLRVELERGLFAGPLGRLFRGPEHPLKAGDAFRLERLEIEVESLAADGSPDSVVYRFALPLEDPSWRWVYWRDGSYLVFEPPSVGETVSLPPPIGPFDRFGWQTPDS